MPLRYPGRCIPVCLSGTRVGVSPVYIPRCVPRVVGIPVVSLGWWVSPLCTSEGVYARCVPQRVVYARFMLFSVRFYAQFLLFSVRFYAQFCTVLSKNVGLKALCALVREARYSLGCLTLLSDLHVILTILSRKW